ncbi:MAG: hypothetical protein COT92_03435 [Candidatus Doudnabacteria bacterium CG10_big_fil_rev_8_21_14_0_10_42_18]|uniref:Major facilitator superfamily (MFS) profile domain-containing protein n=1 Tax=Candidatus Doudnabacteria bacterium CG10_big_fil_rev_8_21_14_0_10_42_18 TaxID=1974552 RepID=A0A2H0VA91_9BACT|nr:MAG: hypothetical protein COT92_03435 [Candidatus Doudnabacteria bacterium CG10_big_fil_rev_8_21_14_0_10_42_18]
MFQRIPIPHYFQSRVKAEIGEIYAYSAISYFARSMMILFEPIFLYSVLGLSLVEVMWYFAAIYAIYVVMIPLGGKLASLFGYRHVMAMSVPFMVAYWFMVAGADGNFWLLMISPFFMAAQKTLLWPAFNAVMARYSDKKEMGSEFGAVYAIIDLMLILGPVAGGFLAKQYGLQITFIVSALVFLASAAPLLMTKEIFTPKVYRFRDTWEYYKTYPKKFLGYMGFGEQAAIFAAWPIFIYIIVKDYQSVGLLATVASLIAAVLALVIGKGSDKYTRKILLKIGSFFTALVWGARFMASSFFGVLLIDGLSKAARETAIIPGVTLAYIRAESSHILPYVIFFEQSAAIGTLLTLLLSILLFSLTGSFVVIFILAGLVSLLYMFI